MGLKFDIYDIVLWILYIIIAIIFIVAGYFAVRVYIADQFVIPSGSMQPALIPGDRVIVNKLIIGARIYDEFDFREGAPVKSHRTRGLRNVELNDIVIFNFPLDREMEKVQFELNYVYGKRCVGLPGDTITIVDGYYKNSNYNGDIGNIDQQTLLSKVSENLTPLNGVLSTCFADSSIKNFGPLYIPRQGDTILITQTNVDRYRLLIEYETGMSIDSVDDSFVLDDIQFLKYSFTKNYYFMCGDNVLDSNDSRYWGFVPEEFIVGVVSHITYSRDRKTNEFRWDRLMKSVLK